MENTDYATTKNVKEIKNEDKVDTLGYIFKFLSKNIFTWYFWLHEFSPSFDMMLPSVIKGGD